MIGGGDKKKVIKNMLSIKLYYGAAIVRGKQISQYLITAYFFLSHNQKKKKKHKQAHFLFLKLAACANLCLFSVHRSQQAQKNFRISCFFLGENFLYNLKNVLIFHVISSAIL